MSVLLLAVVVAVFLLVLLLVIVARSGNSRASYRWAGLLLGAAAAVAVLTFDALGRGLLLAAPVFALCALIGTLAGELVAPGPAGAVRRAGLRVRRLTDYLPRALGAAVAAFTIALLALTSATIAGGSPDDQGRAGRALVCYLEDGYNAGTPWPGSYYAVPLLVLVLAGLILAAAALHRIVRRPQPGGTVEADDAARRHSAQAVTAAGGLLVTVPFAGVALTAAGQLGAAIDNCGDAVWPEPVQYGLLVGAGLAFLTACWCLAVLVGPNRPEPARTAVEAGRAA